MKSAATPDEKIAFLKANASKIKTSSDGHRLLTARFGSSLIYGQIAKVLGLKPASKSGIARAAAAKRGPGRPAKRGPGRPPKSGAKRGPGRPPKVPGKRGPGRPPRVQTGAAGYLVAVGGKGRSFNYHAFATQAEAIAYANMALAAGASVDRLRVFATLPLKVKTSPTVAL